MWQILIAWRGEIIGSLVFMISWAIFRWVLKRPFWQTCIPGMVMGLANEVMTEPEWTYSLQCYIWRDVSPFVIAGWGIVFTWLVTASDELYKKIFSDSPRGFKNCYLKLLLTDLLVGVPLLLSNELFGLHILKVWEYNSILKWNTMIPLIHFPLEGLVALIFFVWAATNSIRFWKGKVTE